MLILNLIISLVQIYMFLIALRIILGWTGIQHQGIMFLGKIVDPYLYLFRRLKFLRFNHLDLSPVAAIALLQMMNYILFSLSYRSSFPGVFEIFDFIVGLVWSLLSFLLALFIILSLIRLLAFAFPSLKILPLWHALDLLLMPPITKIGLILRKGFLTYRTGLVIFIFVLVLLFIAGHWLRRWISLLLMELDVP